MKKRNGGKIRFTAVFPENENTVEARVATLPQVSTMIIIVVVVIFLTFKFHWGVGVLFLLAIAKRFYDFLQNSVFHPYKGTIEFEVNVDDITGIQYNHRLTEDGIFTLEVPKCIMTHYEDTSLLAEDTAKGNGTHEKGKEQNKKDDVASTNKTMETPRNIGKDNCNTNGIRNRKNKNSKRSLLSELDASDVQGNTPNQTTPLPEPSPPDVPFDATYNANNTSTTTTTSTSQMTEQSKHSNYRIKSTELETTMIRISFNEPLVHPIVASFVQRHEQLTHISEDGLPGWATFLALYGLFYRKWMRTAMDVGLWVASISLMLIAMYDLFHNVSAVRHLVGWLFGSWFDWFENAVVVRLMLIVPHLAMFSNFWRLVQTLFGGMKNMCMTCASCMTPCFQCGRMLVVVIGEMGRYVCCCCRGSQAAVQAAAKATPSGSMIMRCYKMCNWIVTLFRRLILGGIGRIGTWLMSHWTSLYRDMIAKRLWTGVGVAVVVVVMTYFFT